MKSLEKIRNVDLVKDSLRSGLAGRGDAPKINIHSLPTLNRKIWGLKERELVIIGARSSNGKSALSCQMAIDIVNQGYFLWFVSLEMVEEDILERMFCNIMEVDNMALLRGEYKRDSRIQAKYRSFETVVNDWELVITEGVGYDFEEIIKVYEAFDEKPKVIILDYIQGISVRAGFATDIMSNYIMKLREFAVKMDISVILVSQINRDAKNERPEMYQLKSTGKLEEHADKVILLHWPWFGNKDEDMRKYEINVAKNRNGVTGIFECEYIPQFYKFKEKIQI